MTDYPIEGILPALAEEQAVKICPHGIRHPWQCHDCDEADRLAPRPTPPAGSGQEPVAWMYQAHTPDGTKRVLVHNRAIHYDGYPVTGETPLYTRLTPPADSAMVEALARVVEPWKSFHGELPDYDHPLRCVYESGIQYAVELLAKELGVSNWEACDGTEEFDGDLGGTMMNIVCAALPKDQNGDDIWPSQVAAMLEKARAEERERCAQWLLSDSTRLNYEASGSEEHFAWWAADAIRAGNGGEG